MNKDTKKNKKTKLANPLISNVPTTSLSVVSDEQLAIVVGGDGQAGPKLPRYQAD